tara:strand:- start:556 stop:960 length:405 start_codon:yes stop_codon:yes gene_type:complete
MTSLEKAFFGPNTGLLDISLFNNLLNAKTKLPINVPYNSYVLSDKTYVVEFALAGYEKDQIKIEVDNSILRIDVSNNTDEDKDYIHHGIKSQGMLLKLQIVNGYDANNIKPSYEQGILKIEIPRAEGAVKQFSL